MGADALSDVLENPKKPGRKMAMTKGRSFAQLPDEIIEQ
jgi:hypothetical protein